MAIFGWAKMMGGRGVRKSLTRTDPKKITKIKDVSHVWFCHDGFIFALQANEFLDFLFLVDFFLGSSRPLADRTARKLNKKKAI